MEKKKISARIVADSVSPQGHRITTFVLTYPRIIHAEVMTHRMFSRNAASSRAIPFKKMVEDIENDPFIPIAWQKDHKGMQGSEYITDQKIIDFKSGVWLQARNEAIKRAKELNSNLTKYKSIDDYEELEGTGVTKQLCNRLLEPFQWYTCLVTATEFDNFYELRCPKFVNEHEEGEDISFSRKDFIKKLKERYPTNWEIELKDFFGIENNTNEEWFSLSESGAEIHIQALAEAMWDAQNESVPKELKAGEWHIPFGDNMDEHDMFHTLNLGDVKRWGIDSFRKELNKAKIKIATARCARLSYMTFDREIDYEKDVKLHDQLLESKHFSPFEHCAKCMDDVEYESFHKGQFVPSMDEIPEDIGMALSPDAFGWCNNFKGFIQYRYLLETEIN